MDGATFDAYLKARERAHEAKLARAHEKQMREYQERLERELLDSVAAPRRYIIDNILTLQCPRQNCGAAFLEFDGCLALTCTICGCGFCGVCMKDCGADAHDHVRVCGYANTRGRAHARADDIPHMQNAWRKDRLQEFLGPLQADVRTRVVDSLARELKDIGLPVDALKGAGGGGGIAAEVRLATCCAHLVSAKFVSV